MKTTYKIAAILVAGVFGYASMSAEEEVYDVDGVKYKIFTQGDYYGKYYGGAYVAANEDESKIYSGKITIPAEVTLNGKTYPVWGFEKLSLHSENETKDLEIVLPEGLKVFSGWQALTASGIKHINIPSTVKEIYYWKYYLSAVDSVRLHAELILEDYCYFAAKYVEIEDGFRWFAHGTLRCLNDTLVLPGSVDCESYAISDKNLKCLHITKSKTGKSPIFKNHFFTDCFKIESVICEYEVPPTANTHAFMNEGDNEELGITGRATLYVPAEAIEAYRAHPEWGKFKEILPITNGVSDITADEAAEVIATEYYDLSGRRLQAPAESGITIVATRYSDGSRRTAKLAK